MTTFVGIQEEFIDAVKDLIELDFDSIEAYQAAINRVHNEDYKTKLSEFMADHQRHVNDLSALVEKHGSTPPTTPSVGKQWITKGKIVIANLIGDEAVLKAMADNEKDTIQAYKRMSERTDQWEEAKDILKRGLEDERRHKAWLDEPS
jgi:uncharacterized protein (TIGR02284 family)